MPQLAVWFSRALGIETPEDLDQERMGHGDVAESPVYHDVPAESVAAGEEAATAG
jgi:hypothetical protein